MSDDEFRALVHQHEADIQVIKSDLGALRAGFVQTNQKLDRLIEAVSAKGHATVTDIAQWLQILVLGSALIGGIVTGIVYVAGNSNAAELALLKYRIERVYGSFGWEPKLLRESGN